MIWNCVLIFKYNKIEDTIVCIHTLHELFVYYVPTWKLCPLWTFLQISPFSTWHVHVSIPHCGAMSAQERQLLQQVKALRKENDAYKVEFRELRQEVKNYKELLANSQMRNRQLQNNLAHFHQLETAHNRLQTEHRQLLKDFSALSKKHKLSSSKNFLDLTRNERKTIRNRLKRYFLQSLKVSDIILFRDK